MEKFTMAAARRTTYEYHGLSGSLEYQTWELIKKRVATEPYTNKNIGLCERWGDSFKNFLEDMGKRPTAAHTIDRIDNDGDYSPKNCRWATRKEQAINRGKYRTNSTGYTGVYPKRNKWSAAICIDGRMHYFGVYDTKIEAAYVYDQVRLQLYGDNATTNFKWSGNE